MARIRGDLIKCDREACDDAPCEGRTHDRLLETFLTIGDNVTFGNERVLHGLLRVGNNFMGEDGMALFRGTVEDNVTLRVEAAVVGDVVLRERTIMPEGAVIETQEQADALPTR